MWARYARGREREDYVARAQGKCKKRQGKVNRARWVTFETFLSMKCDICSILSSTVAGPSISVIASYVWETQTELGISLSRYPQQCARYVKGLWEEPCCACREVWLSDSNQAVGVRLSWSGAQQHPSVTNSSCSSLFIPHRQVAEMLIVEHYASTKHVLHPRTLTLCFLSPYLAKFSLYQFIKNTAVV